MSEEDFILIKADDKTGIYFVPSSDIIDIPENVFTNLLKGGSDDNTKELEEFVNSLGKMKVEYSKESDGVLNNLIFISSEHCNLRCKYCFADGGSYSAESPQNMKIETYIKTVEYVINRYPKGIKNICFFGGEPLINFNEIMQFIKYYQAEYLIHDELEKTTMGIITNGTLLTEEMRSFFNECDVDITLSIDGPKVINDEARVFLNDGSVYDTIFNKFQNWTNRKIAFSIEATINNTHIKNYKKGVIKDWLHDLEQLKYDSIGWIPVNTNIENMKIERKDYDIVKRIYEEITDYTFDVMCEKAFKKGLDITIVGMIDSLLRKQYTKNCSVGNTLSITPLGDVYPCQTFYAAKEFKFGNIHENKPYEPKFVEKIKKYNRMDVEKCRKCHARFLCGMWCKGQNQMSNGQIDSTIDLICLVTNTILNRVIKNIFLLSRDENQEKLEYLVKNLNQFKAYISCVSI